MRSRPWYLRSLRAWLLGGLALLALPPALAVDPTLQWFTLTTEHFRVHYASDQAELAQRLAGLAEQVHPPLSERLAWEPGTRTDLVLSDGIDLANGFATPFPFNYSQIYAVSPDDVSGLEDYADWLELVFVHEYTHVLHLDRGEGAPGWLRNLLGRNPLLFPNLYQPQWMIEGLATYQETDRERGVGRGQSSYYEMLMRMEVAAGIKPFDQVSMAGLTKWPAGAISYLYGVHFHQFVAAEYGASRIRRLADEYSDNIIPFLTKRNFRRALGRDTGWLWPAFEDYLERRYGGQLQRIESAGLAEGERLTAYGYYTSSAVAAGERVFFVREDLRRHPAVMAYTPESGVEHVADVHSGARLDHHPRGGLLVAQPELCESRNLYYDLYRLDPADGDTTRLTECGRYHFAAWSPEGGHIAAARLTGNGPALVLLDAHGEVERVLWQGALGEVVSNLTWQPDGGALVASVFRMGRGWDLERFDLEAGAWERLTHGAIIETDPAFGPRGRYLYFSSDHGDVYNLRRLDMRTGTMETLSNVRGGAFSPAPDGAGGVYYVGYTADGFDLFRLPEPVERPVPSGAEPALKDTTVGEVPAEAYTPTDYSPWRSLSPRWWFPWLYADTDVLRLSAVTTGHDALRVHSYAAELNYDFANQLPGGGASYTYDGRYTAAYRRSYSYYYDEADDGLAHVRSQDQLQLIAGFPWLRRDQQLIGFLGAGWQWERDAASPADLDIPPTREGILGVAGRWDTTNLYRRAISEADGRRVQLVAETNDALAGAYAGEVYTVDWNELLGPWGGHIVSARLIGGWGTDRPRPFELGGTQPGNDGPLASSFIFNRRAYPLRGYPTGLDRLRGRRMALGSLEWRFPLATIQRAWETPALGVHRLSGAMFVETGDAWTEGDEPTDFATGAGAQLSADLNAFYLLNYRLTLGYARGFDEGGEHQAYLTLGLPFSL